eukprot:3786833-Alexandrium_andersonii.AAC.1
MRPCWGNASQGLGLPWARGFSRGPPGLGFAARRFLMLWLCLLPAGPAACCPGLGSLGCSPPSCDLQHAACVAAEARGQAAGSLLAARRACLFGREDPELVARSKGGVKKQRGAGVWGAPRPLQART